MATITTTIREPKTFQQIQDQQNELGKNQTLESLNNNISKLIKAITDRDQKRETEQDRQLKMNQLELSKLQLRRAQLGLAKDEKYYSDYSRKWSEKNNFGTSIGLDKNTSGNIGAIGVSALTAGALNPVIVKNLLFPIMTPLMNVTKALATFPGLLPGLFRRSSGKSSSAIESDPDRKLHGKLDQILGAIKDKTKSSKPKEEKEQSMLSKFLNALLLGAAGMFAASELFGKPKDEILTILKDYGPAMVAGYALGGWKGALVAGGLVLGYKAWQDLIGETKKTPEQIEDEEKALAKINSYIPIDFLKFKDMGHFKATVAGLMIGGLKGAAAGWAFGKYSNTIKKWLGKLPNEDEDDQNNNEKEENEDDYLQTLAKALGLNTPESVLPVLAGFYLKGIHGATFGYLCGQILTEIELAKKYRDAIKRGDEIEAEKIKEDMDDAKYRATLSGALAGFMTGGVGGALMGGMMSFFSAELAEAYGLSGTLSGAINTVLDQNYLGVPAEVWMGCISLASLAMNMPGASVKTVVAAALIGALGGFIADRYRSKELIEELGFESNWDWSSASYTIGNTNLRIEDIRQEARNNLIAAGVAYTEEDLKKESIRLLKEKHHVQTKDEIQQEQLEKDKQKLNYAINTYKNFYNKLKQSGQENEEVDIVNGLFENQHLEEKDKRIKDDLYYAAIENFKKTKFSGILKTNLFNDNLEDFNVRNNQQFNFLRNYIQKSIESGSIMGERAMFLQQALLGENIPLDKRYEVIKAIEDIINKENEEKIKEGKQKKEQEDAKDKALRQASEQANIEMNQREKNKKESDKQQIIVTNESTDTTGSSSDSNGNKPWG